MNINLLATSLSNKVDFLLIELADINIISTAKKFDASRGFIGGDDYLVYDLLKKNQIEAVIVDYWKRIPKESFQNWYKSQSGIGQKKTERKMLFWKMQLLRCLRWHSSLEQPEA